MSSSRQRPAAGTPEDPVLAAGVILWRLGEDGPEFLLLRNARHGTWGFAKGHLDDGEELVQAAVREVREETGFEIAAADLDPEFADTCIYRPSAGNWKRVVHFLARAPGNSEGFVRSKEHDDAGWFGEAAALERCGRDNLRRALIRAAGRIERCLNK